MKEEFVFETGKEAVEFATDLMNQGYSFEYIGSSWTTHNPGNFGVVIYAEDEEVVDF
jgi:hypothetical protein